MSRAPALPATLIALAAPQLPATVRASPVPLVRMDMVDRDTGRWLPAYRHRHGEWIAGIPGHRYAIRLANTTGERLLVVLSVDGVNAVTGETAHASRAGYVLEPWQTAGITGWRKSYSEVAQFVFTALADSCAARTGHPDDVGTIGIAVFRGQRPVHRPAPVAPPAARAQVPSGAAGHAGGRKRHGSSPTAASCPIRPAGTGTAVEGSCAQKKRAGVLPARSVLVRASQGISSARTRDAQLSVFSKSRTSCSARSRAQPYCSCSFPAR